MLNTNYQREYFFNIDDYLINNYSLMNLETRRAICSIALGAIDDELLEKMIDQVVADYAIDQMKFRPDESDC
jgi:hypothetical protein